MNPRKSEIDIMVGPSNSAAYAEIRPIPGKNWPIYEKKKKTSQQQQKKRNIQTKTNNYANGENNNLCNIVNHQTKTSTFQKKKKSTRQTPIIPTARHYQLQILRKHIAHSIETIETVSHESVHNPSTETHGKTVKSTSFSTV